MTDKVTDSLQNRIDAFAIAYVQSHYDVKDMSVTEYMDTIGEITQAIFDWYVEQ